MLTFTADHKAAQDAATRRYLDPTTPHAALDNIQYLMDTAQGDAALAAIEAHAVDACGYTQYQGEYVDNGWFVAVAVRPIRYSKGHAVIPVGTHVVARTEDDGVGYKVYTAVSGTRLGMVAASNLRPVR